MAGDRYAAHLHVGPARALRAWILASKGLFLEAARDAETQRRIGAAMNRGFQTRDAEMDLDRMVAELAER